MLLSQMTDQIGRVLGGRYRLVAPIGSGSSAQVFLAQDVRLERRVAVKVLHPALAEDRTFLRRFRAEAQATAKLNHPHIVTLFDSGDDDGPYLVTEFVGGGSLRGMLDQGRRLTVAQAAAVGAEAAKGLDFAHRQGFVHRDIKPANLLFGEDRRLRIADFGVARALAEAAWTEPGDAILGTARYSSPEQAQGQLVTGKGDIYSLALVLVESITGDVPFAADTTIATLMARVGASLPIDERLGPLADVLAAAAHPEPEERPTAAELAEGLLDVADALDAPAPLELAGAFPDDPEAFHDPDPTILPEDGVLVLPDEDADTARNGAKAVAVGALVAKARGALEGRRRDRDEPSHEGTDDGRTGDGRTADRRTGDGRTGDMAEAASATNGAVAASADAAIPPPTVVRTDNPTAALRADTDASPPIVEHTGAPARPARRRRSILLVLAGVVVLVVAVLGARVVAELLRPRHEVPDLADQNIDDVVSVARENGWNVDREQTRKDGTREGQIVAQRPDAGSQLREGQTLHVTISRGAELVAVPDNLARLTQGEADAALEAVGLHTGEISEKWGEFVPAGIVLGESLIYDEVPAGTRVPLVVSKGPRPRQIPDGLAGAGLSYDEAASAIQSVQLVPVRGEDYSDSVPEGQVIGTSPPGGTEVPRDSQVTVIVSKGPRPVIIPDVAGDSVAEAQSALEALGLVVDGVDGPPNGVVTGTDPSAGLQVDRGTSIVLQTQRRTGGGNANAAN